MSERVKAIRANDRVGRGSCTIIDECYGDDEIIAMLDDENIATPKDAVLWAIQRVGANLEQALNCRWGSDDDPQLKAYDDWMIPGPRDDFGCPIKDRD